MKEIMIKEKKNMFKILKGMVWLVAMVAAVCFMVIIVLPKLDKDNSNEVNNNNNGQVNEGNENRERVYSNYTPVFTLKIGEKSGVYYRYDDYPHERECIVDYAVGYDGEFVLLDVVANQLLVYDGDTLRFRYVVGDEYLLREIHCTEEGYIVNYSMADEWATELIDSYVPEEERIGSIAVDRNGKVIRQGEWFYEEKKPTENMLALIGMEEDYNLEVYKVDDEGNFYIRKSTIISTESEYCGVYYEKSISKYSPSGDRVAYAVYYSHDKKQVHNTHDVNFYQELYIDHENNIYVMSCEYEKIDIYRVTLGLDDDELLDKRIETYIANCSRYATKHDEMGDETYEWIEIKEPQDGVWNLVDSENLTVGPDCYIMEIEDGIISIEEMRPVDADPYSQGYEYYECIYERQTFELAEDVQVWCWYEAGTNKGVIDLSELEIYEGKTYTSKPRWKLYLNEEGKVQYIEEVYIS